MSQRLRARCSVQGCGYTWVVAYLPMDLTLVAELAKRAACARCGSTAPSVDTSVQCDWCGATSGKGCTEAECNFPNQERREFAPGQTDARAKRPPDVQWLDR
jgi:hypothetical protein